ncbi:MAG TPA: pyridoxal phosphate-dependent aminotransferase [Candidatus Hodarchaeales archaeon]|nr:pyridoxal phosphate-dependent aminotransferase [Candidatus Hodarchaeales archaeon]
MRILFEIAGEMRRQGRTVYDFGLGDIDIPLHPAIKEAMNRAVDNGITRYGPNAGELTLREKLADFYGTKYHVSGLGIENVMITCGALEGLFDTIIAYSDPDSEVILHEPSFRYFNYICKIAGARPTVVDTDPTKDFVLDPAKVQDTITAKTKSILINFPTNPTSAVLDRKTMKAIVEIAEDAGLLLISDESYENILFDETKHISALEFGYDKTLVLSSFSKSLCMTGLRVGYLVAPSKEVLSPILQIHQYNTAHANRPAQYGALAGLERIQEIQENVVSILGNRRKRFKDSWGTIPGVKIRLPAATFYFYPDISGTGMTGKEFSDFAVKNGVIVVPGTEFGEAMAGTTNHVRISFGVGQGNIIEDAAQTLIVALEKRR